MRWASRVVAVAALCTGSFLAAAPAAAQNGERIRGYDVELRVEASGVLQVTERIDYDFGTAQKHGIVRAIPVRSRYDDRRDRVNPVTVQSVHGTPGSPDQYRAETNGQALNVQIGDPGRTVSGRHGYTIVYRVEGVLNGFADHDELYWNAVGTEWPVPIDRVSVQVVAPAVISQVAGYRGPRGSRRPAAGLRTDGATASFEDTGLAPGEGMTVVVAFPVGAVPPPRPILAERWSLARAFSVTPLTVGLFGVLSLLALAGGWLLLRSGRDRRPTDVLGIDGATPLAEYRPPDGLRPGLAGLLIHETVRPVHVTATIVDLAARGYLRIEEAGTGGSDWRLVRLTDPDDGLLRYERLLLDALFSTPTGTPGSEVVMSTLKNRFAAQYSAIREALYDEAMGRGWFTARPDRVRIRAFVAGGLVCGLGVALTIAAARFTYLGLVPIPIALAGLAIVTGAWWLPRRTATGHVLFQRVAGFRAYLHDTGLAAPIDSAPGHPLGQYLPYAMVFGLTAQWRNAVDLSRAAAGLGAYVGLYPFLSDRFADHADDFSHTWADALTSTPASGSSGFGGASGGGGGGGGGGSW